MTFTGTVKTYDALDRGTWGAAVAGATSIARATAGFSKKNARFFAGYAFDARQVPLAWTPPGRVFVGVDLERTALLDERGRAGGPRALGGRGAVARHVPTHGGGADPLAALPAEVAESSAVPARDPSPWAASAGRWCCPCGGPPQDTALYAALPAETLALAGAGPDAPVALTVDRPRRGGPGTWWAPWSRGGACYLFDELGSGAKTARALATAMHPDADALVGINPERLVWWKGWSSGSATA